MSKVLSVTLVMLTVNTVCAFGQQLNTRYTHYKYNDSTIVFQLIVSGYNHISHTQIYGAVTANDALDKAQMLMEGENKHVIILSVRQMKREKYNYKIIAIDADSALKNTHTKDF